jgi:hypothetical protein
MVLERSGAFVVRVPLVERLRPELLVAILKTVGVSPAQFTAWLDDAEPVDASYVRKRQ